jgi:hypothetical protein
MDSLPIALNVYYQSFLIESLIGFNKSIYPEFVQKMKSNGDVQKAPAKAGME